jgi:hypothetical protein
VEFSVQNLEMLVFSESHSVNYLHLGDALDDWTTLRQLAPPAGPRLQALLEEARSGSRARTDLEKLIRGYLSLSGKKTAEHLQREFDNSVHWRERFHQLGCRGFSYLFDREMAGYNSRPGRRCKIRDEINLRYALLPARGLYYPGGVWKYLQGVHAGSNHYFKDTLPSIAFCFGKKTADAWHILLLQSDLACEGPSLIRDHFRGWRKVLAANVMAQARGRTPRVLLCRAQDAERACFPNTKVAGKLSERWLSLYDGTAREWGMRLVRLDAPVDIQLYCGQAPIWCEYFYELPLDRDAVYSGYGSVKMTEEPYVPQPCDSAPFGPSFRQEY